MSLENLEITDRRLGEGGFGSVFVCKLDGKEVAAKKLSQSEREFLTLVREASRLNRLRHGKHIAYTYGFTFKEEGLYMVMEYSERGDLQNYLKANKESVTYEQKILFCRGILLGLLYCHSMKIYHGDIKCSNVILGKNLEPKLTDFGLSMTVDNIESYCKTYEGSIHWTAPEMFSMEEESSFEEFKANPYPTDVYSLGATFCQVSFDGTTEFIDSYDIEMDISLGLVSPISKDGFLEKIVDGCCQFECNKRISLDECLTMLDVAIEKQLLVPTIDDKWREIQKDIKTNSKLELPPSFILHRPTENLVLGSFNLSLLEWLCINNCVDAVEYIIQPNEYGQYDQSQIKWLCGISELCKSRKTVEFLQSLMWDREFSRPILSDLADNYPQQFIEMLIKAGASSCSYNLLKKAIKRRHNMIAQAVIDTTSSFNTWAICDAIKFGNAEVVKIIVDAGVNLEWKDDPTGDTPLKVAIDIENIEIVKILLGFGAGIDNKNNPAQISKEAEIQCVFLRLAALKGNREIVKLLIDAGATIDITSNEWSSLSQDLKQQGDVSMACFIRNSISKMSNTAENNPLCATIQKKQSELVQRLIVDGEDMDGISLDGYALLHWATIIGDEEAVGILIRAGADLDIRTSKKTQGFNSAFAPDCLGECTPLHIAIFKRHLGIAKLLIESGADFSARNGLQQTIMDIAKEDKKKIEKIVREYAPINIVSIRRAMKSMSLESVKIMISNRQINTKTLSECLCIAASSGKNDLIEYLLECKVNINKEYQGKTPLRWAIFGRNIKTVKALINAGADINAMDQDKITPLTEYIERSNIEMVQFLIDKGADATTRNVFGNAPICCTDEREIAEILINAGADISTGSKYGQTLLIYNLYRSNIEMVQFLIDKGVDLNARDFCENASIHYAKNIEIMKILINAGADVNAKGQFGETPLIQHAIKSNAEIIQFLVDKGADVNAGDKDGNTPIHYANDKEIMKILINAGADINAKNQDGETPLIQHVSKSNTETVRFLVDKGADVNAKDKNGHTPISHANKREIAEILIAHGAEINAKNQDGEISLINHIKKSNTEMVQFLVDKGADVNAKDKYGYAHIHYTDDKEITEILINAGASAKNQSGRISLIQYVKKSDAEMVQLLVDKGVDVNTRDEDDNAPIHYADKREIIEILINAGADFNVKNEYGKTPLIQHVNKPNIEVLKLLIEKGADVNARDEGGYAPIYHINDMEIMKILINAGANVNEHGTIFLIECIKDSSAEMVQLLVDKGVDVNARDEDGNMPIHYANNREIMQILINAGADIDAKGEYERTCLIQSAKGLNTDVVRFLVEKGANVDAKDAYGNTPIHYMNDKEIIEILINTGADVNAKNKYEKTPLIFHVRGSNIEIVQYLIDKGANVNAKDKDGNVPIHFVRDRKIAEILITAGADISVKDRHGKALFDILIEEQNINLSSSQYKRKKICELLEYLREVNKN